METCHVLDILIFIHLATIFLYFSELPIFVLFRNFPKKHLLILFNEVSSDCLEPKWDDGQGHSFHTAATWCKILMDGLRCKEKNMEYPRCDGVKQRYLFSSISARTTVRYAKIIKNMFLTCFFLIGWDQSSQQFVSKHDISKEDPNCPNSGKRHRQQVASPKVLLRPWITSASPLRLRESTASASCGSWSEGGCYGLGKEVGRNILVGLLVGLCLSILMYL